MVEQLMNQVSTASASILIIEDDADTRANLMDILDLFGLDSLAAGSVREALGLRRLSDVSIVLIDRKLPDGMCEFLIPRIRERLPNADFIIATAYADLDSSIEAVRLGASDYLLKPIYPDALRVAIGRILDRRRLDREKQRSEAAFRNLVESAGSVIMILRPDRTIAYLNPYGEHFTGYEQSAIQGRDLVEVFVPEEEQVEIREALASVLDGRPMQHYEHSFRCRDGARRWMVCNARRLDDYDGEPAVLAIGQDITARRAAELRSRLLDSAIAVLEEGVLISAVGSSGDEVDGERADWFTSRIEYANNALVRITGYLSGEIIGRTPQLLECAETNRTVMAELNEHLRTSRSFTCECVLQRRDGEVFPAELHLSPVLDSSGRWTHTVATIRDITQRKAAEKRLVQAERLAAIGKAMTGLAHESRNALQRSQAALDLLAADLEENQQATKYLKRIQVAQDDLHRLYEDVREYARPIRIDPRLQPIDELLHLTWEELIVKRDGRRAALKEVHETEDLSCEVEGFLIRQVFRNILDNALAACPDPVEITVTWSETRIAMEPALRISFRDNGPGVPLSQLEQIFEEFFTTRTHGTGLGLAIVRRLMVAHGGSITASQPDPDRPGLELVLTLPRHAR